MDFRTLGKDDFQRMNLPAEFWEARLKQVPASALEAVTNYITNLNQLLKEGVGFTLSGGPGVGKTGIAAVLAKAARSSKHTVFFTSISDLREFIRAKSNFDDSSSVLERCKSVDLLVLDGLRIEDVKEAPLNAAMLEGIVQTRVAWKRSTILTTRLTKQELDESFSGLLEVSRASAVFLPVSGPNLREQAEKALKARVIKPKS